MQKAREAVGKKCRLRKGLGGLENMFNEGLARFLMMGLLQRFSLGGLLLKSGEPGHPKAPGDR